MMMKTAGARKICLIGPPGVGKSTLYRTLSEHPWFKKNILTAVRAQKRVSGQLSALDLRTFAIKKALLGPVLSRGQGGLADWFVRSESKETLAGLQTRYAPLINADYRGLVDEVTDPVKRAAAFAFFMRMINDEILFDQFAGDSLLMLDDSVWQSLRGFTGFSAGVPGNLPVPSMVLNCTADTQVVLERIEQRRQAGKLNVVHRELDWPALEAMTGKEIDNARFKSDFLAGLGVPVLTLDMGMTLEERTGLALPFIRGKTDR